MDGVEEGQADSRCCIVKRCLITMQEEGQPELPLFLHGLARLNYLPLMKSEYIFNVLLFAFRHESADILSIYSTFSLLITL